MGVLDQGLQRYFSTDALRVLRSASVGIIGAGGLGSNVAMMLARSGIRLLTLADPDVVDASNLNRQVYLPEDVGSAKVLALARHLKALEPSMELVLYAQTVTQENASSLFASCPIVVEAVDDAGTKAMLYACFAPEKALYVTASGMAGVGRQTPMVWRRPRRNVVAVGDFSSAVDSANHPFAPRVMQAAAMQADAVLAHLLSTGSTMGECHAKVS